MMNQYQLDEAFQSYSAPSKLQGDGTEDEWFVGLPNELGSGAK